MIDKDLVLPFYRMFSGCSICPFFLFPCVSVCHFGLVVFYDVFLSFLFFFASCLCCTFMFYGYHEVCIEHLINRIVLFLLIASYLHLPIHFPPFSSFLLILKIRLFFILLLNLGSSFCILDINFWSNMLFENIVSQSVACLFIPLMRPF